MTTQLYPPESLKGLVQGIDQISNLLALTLGPRQGVIYSASGPGKPERLTDAGVIARRVTELPSRSQDVGAMLLRGMAQQMQEQYQDGVATAAVLTQALVKNAVRQIAAGANAMQLRRGLAVGLDAALQALAEQSQTADTQPVLENLVRTAIGDEELAQILGEIFSLLGKYGSFMVEEYAVPGLDRAYIDGGRWRCRPASRHLMPPGGTALTLHQPLIAVIDEKIESFTRLRPLLELVHRMKTPLLLVCKELRGEALETLSANYQQGVLNLAAAVSTASISRISEDLDDMALLTGATVLRDASGRTPERVRPELLGRARQMTLDADSLTIMGGTGDKAAMQAQIMALQGRISRHIQPDEDWEHLRLRAARLAGSMAILKVGAHTAQERELRKTAAKTAMRILELAMISGAVPGGGVAHLGCIPVVLEARSKCQNEDERRGVELLADALKTPFLRIVRNQGQVHPPLMLARVQQVGPGTGYDVCTDRVVSMFEAGIVDSVAVVRGGLAAAVSTAGAALTTDAVILRTRH